MKFKFLSFRYRPNIYRGCEEEVSGKPEMKFSILLSREFIPPERVSITFPPTPTRLSLQPTYQSSNSVGRIPYWNL